MGIHQMPKIGGDARPHVRQQRQPPGVEPFAENHRGQKDRRPEQQIMDALRDGQLGYMNGAI